MSKPPIEPQDYLNGTKVVQIDDLRVARGKTRRPASSCKHKNLLYDEQERRIWCSDCENEVEPFDAFMGLVAVHDAAISSINARAEKLREAEQFQIRSRAAKVMDEAWRSRTMVPLCPHCVRPILPEDVANGVAETSRNVVVAQRKHRKDDNKPE